MHSKQPALPYGNLQWTSSNLSHSVEFLDLMLEIMNGKVVTRTYEKPLNLFLYLSSIGPLPWST
jgi:hypothetical protein